MDIIYNLGFSTPEVNNEQTNQPVELNFDKKNYGASHF